MILHLRTLFLGVAVIAALLGVFRGFCIDGKTNHHLLLGLYLVIVTCCTVAAIPRSARFRGGLLGAAGFGILYFATSLRAGYGLQSIYDSQALTENTLAGFGLLGVAFLLSQLLTTLLWSDASGSGGESPRTDAEERSS